MCNQDSEGIFCNLQESQKKNNQLKNNFSIFTEECKNTSQICHYFEHFLYMTFSDFSGKSSTDGSKYFTNFQ